MRVLILVTGGAGFIGGRLVSTLAAAGREVVVLDDLSGGSAESLPPGVPLVEADITDPGVAGLIARLGPRAVIHAAAQVSVSASVGDPGRDRAVNVEGTENVISGATAAGAGRLVFLSSGGAVYGESDGANEQALPDPVNYYGAHKYLAERYVALSGLSFAVARLANVYGPGQRAGLEGGVVAIFLDRLRSGAPITVNGTGHQRRDFVYVGDVVDALLAMLDSGLCATWNVGTGIPTSVLQLLETLQAELGLTPNLDYAPPRPGDVESSRLRPDLLFSDLGWRPRHSLSAGLRQTIETLPLHGQPF